MDGVDPRGAASEVDDLDVVLSGRRAVLLGGIGLYMAALGFLGGMLSERIRFDHQRAAVLEELAREERDLHQHLMQVETAPAHGVPAGD